MPLLLGDVVEGKKAYLLGRITSKIGRNRYKLVFGEKQIIVVADEMLDVNTWIRAYGTVRSGALNTIFLEKLNGIDTNLLRRAVIYIKERL